MRGKGKKKKKKKGKDIEMMFGVSQLLLLLLPEDILIFKILVRLPIVDILRCPSVCKQWYSIINTPDFISAHLFLSSSSSQPTLFVHQYCCPRRRHVLSSRFDPKSLEDCHTVPFSFPSTDSLIIFGPILGLFCICKDNDNSSRRSEFYCLWSPSVRRYIRLPSPISDDVDNLGYGFGFDDVNKDYKVVVLGFLKEMDYNWNYPLNCQLFSLKEGSWWTVSSGEYAECSLVSNRGCFVNEALHWVAEKYNYKDRSRLFVLAFNIAHENFKGMELPQKPHSSHEYSVIEIKGSLACFDYGNFYPIEEPEGVYCYSIWVMKEYGAANSWVKMWTFDQMGALSSVHGFWGNGDEILLEMEDENGDKDLLLYDTKTHISRDFGGDAKPHIYSICGYTKSLILLDKKSGVDSY